MNSRNNKFQFKIKNKRLTDIFADLFSLGVYQGSKNPIRILPYTETSGDVAFVQTHVGCRFNNCSYCYFYKDLNYYEKDEAQIYSEVDLISSYYRNHNDLNVSHVMLLDADALHMDNNKLFRILQYIRQTFPQFKKKNVNVLDWDATSDCFYTEELPEYTLPVELSSFVHTDTILQKGQQFFMQLRQRGLTHLWWGVESGSEELLKAVCKIKRTNNRNEFQKILKAGHILNSTGFFYVMMIMIGLGGERFFNEHVERTSLLFQQLNPPGIAFSDLVIAHNTIYYEHIKNNTLDKLSDKRIKKQRTLLENCILDSLQFDYVLENVHDPTICFK